MSVCVPAPGWQIRTDVSPDWIFLRVTCSEVEADGSPPIAETAWSLAEEQGVNRMVVELDESARLTSYLIGQLVLLHKRCYLDGGIVRLCGMSEPQYSVIQLMRLAERLPNYANREAAVMGYRP
jgi:anti-anti-sigma regulatory factor